MAIAIDSNILIDLLGKPTAFTAHAGRLAEPMRVRKR